MKLLLLLLLIGARWMMCLAVTSPRQSKSVTENGQVSPEVRTDNQQWTCPVLSLSTRISYTKHQWRKERCPVVPLRRIP